MSPHPSIPDHKELINAAFELGIQLSSAGVNKIKLPF